ncbi:MAG: riboflavin synthase, partial [Gemmatimonadota bacterium]|nr:riboflavin synthase [Gemmatimonadota bacterium]
SEVNLERAVKMGSRLDGHFVQGHVDAVGRVIGMEERGGYRLIDFEIPPEVGGMIVLHGSIAINGVSLTINEISDDGRCQVGIIPFTWENTNLRNLLAGNQVNVETDLIGKYVRNLMRDPFSEIQV